jgi:Tfp pilus assembly protein PilN
MGIFKKKKELDLLTAEEVGVVSSHKILPIIFGGFVILLTLGIYLVFFLLNINAQNQLNSAKDKVVSKSVTWQSYQQIATDIKIIQAKYTNYKSFSTAYKGLDQKIDKIRSVLPIGVYLTNLTISNAGTVSLTGSSATPEEAYQFRDVLLTDKNFSGISLESVSKSATNYTFIIDFLVQAI